MHAHPGNFAPPRTPSKIIMTTPRTPRRGARYCSIREILINYMRGDLLKVRYVRYPPYPQQSRHPLSLPRSALGPTCSQAIDAVVKHESVTQAEALAVFEEPRRVSKYAAGLEQLNTGRKIRWGGGSGWVRGWQGGCGPAWARACFVSVCVARGSNQGRARVFRALLQRAFLSAPALSGALPSQRRRTPISWAAAMLP